MQSLIQTDEETNEKFWFRYPNLLADHIKYTAKQNLIQIHQSTGWPHQYTAKQMLIVSEYIINTAIASPSQNIVSANHLPRDKTRVVHWSMLKLYANTDHKARNKLINPGKPTDRVRWPALLPLPLPPPDGEPASTRSLLGRNCIV